MAHHFTGKVDLVTAQGTVECRDVLPKYSFRTGAMTTTAKIGVSNSLIKDLGIGGAATHTNFM